MKGGNYSEEDSEGGGSWSAWDSPLRLMHMHRKPERMEGWGRGHCWQTSGMGQCMLGKYMVLPPHSPMLKRRGWLQEPCHLAVSARTCTM